MTYDFRLTTASGRTLHVATPADVSRHHTFDFLWDMPGEVVTRVEIKTTPGGFRDVPKPAAP